MSLLAATADGPATPVNRGFPPWAKQTPAQMTKLKRANANLMKDT
jgi:hypothetical protein